MDEERRFVRKSNEPPTERQVEEFKREVTKRSESDIVREIEEKLKRELGHLNPRCL